MNSSNKIFFFADANSNHTRKWVDFFLEKHFTIKIFCFYPVQDNWGIEKNVEIVSFFKDNKVSLVKKLSYVFSIFQAKKELNSFNPDFINVHYASSYGMIAAFASPNKYFLNFWGSDVFVFPKSNIITKYLLKYIISRSKKIFSSSKIMTEEIKKYTTKKIHTIPYGVDTKKYFAYSKLKESKNIKIGVVKTLSPIYRIDLAIEAIKKLNFEGEFKFELHIVGDGNEKKKLLNISDENIIFHGKLKQNKVADFLNTLDIYLNTTEFESFGVSTIEAMACGIPVVAHGVGGAKEIIEHNKDGILYTPNNIENICEAILSLLKNKSLKENVIKNARSKVENLYNIDKNTFEMLQHFNNTEK